MRPSIWSASISRCSLTIAILMMSAASDCIGKLIAIRSAALRSWKLGDRRSGIARCRRRGVDVLAGGKRAQQLRVAAQVRRDAQLDLRVVCRDHHMVRSPGFERAADALTKLAANRDVHEVGVGR